MQLAQHDIAVGDGKWPATTIAGRPGIGPGAFRSDTEPRTVKLAQRSAPRRHRMDQQHRCLHAHTRNNCLEHAFIVIFVMRHIGRGAAHVKSDHLVKTGLFGRTHCPDNATGRPGQNGILALKQAGPFQAAVRLHELQIYISQCASDAINIAAQNGRKVSIGNGGIPAPDKFYHRAGVMAGRHLGKADLAGQRGNADFMVWQAIAMHQHNGNGPDAIVKGGLQARGQIIKVQRHQHLVMRINSLIHLFDAFIQHLGKDDLPVEQPWARLIGNAQLVPKSLCDDEQRSVTLALQQGVCRHSGAHLHRVYFRFGHRRIRGQPQQITNALQRCILIGLGIFRQQLVRVQAAIRRPPHDIGKCPATVNPELPSCLAGYSTIHLSAPAFQNRLTLINYRQIVNVRCLLHMTQQGVTA